jgi:gamma-glutamyl:cysteine ligase YbdK (ATP-grasp superfamily)
VIVLHAFEACGLEIEYALVERAGLDVAPIGDAVLRKLSGASTPVNDYLHDGLGWSNELVMHVLELKNARPAADLTKLAPSFQTEVGAMNHALSAFDARLMPGGMHPWMDPARETRLWPHDNAEIYRRYDEIFDCRRHGWANLQSTHINLPFANETEFARLHAALRVIVPILPAIAAASPFAEGRDQDALDHRMEVYRTNADAVPALNGDLVPDIVTNHAEYDRIVLQPMYRSIAPHDPDGVLQHEWLNARTVVARFDRNALEIRVMDTQECPAADVAFAALVFDLAQSLYERQFSLARAGSQLPNRDLAAILLQCLNNADKARLDDPAFLQLFGVVRRECTAGALWETIAERLDRENARYATLWKGPLEFVLLRGPLARRLLRATGPRPSRAALHELYAALCDALAQGRQFDP